MDYKKLNDYSPAKDVLPDVYHGFKKEVKEFKETEYKSTIDPVDRPVDEAVWLFETVVNNTLGFNDSIEVENRDTITIVLDNIGFSNSGVPIIEGNSLVNEFQNFENTVFSKQQENVLLYLVDATIINISQSNSIIQLGIVEGEKGNVQFIFTPRPPGFQIDPFPIGYNQKAGTVASTMSYAEIDYWHKIVAPGLFVPGPGWILESDGDNNFTPLGGWTSLLWDDGSPESYTLYNNELNYYLYKTKELIDANNPVSDPERIIGYFSIGSYQLPANSYKPDGSLSVLPWFEHGVYIHWYKWVWVGLPK